MPTRETFLLLETIKSHNMNKLLFSITLLCSMLLFSCQKDIQDKEPKESLNTSSAKKIKKGKEFSVRIIYVVPADRKINRTYVNAIRKAAPILQDWYKQQMDGKTYRLNHPLIEIVQSDKTAAWFSANNGSMSGDNEFYYFFYNTYTEVSRLLGSEWDLSKYRFTIYVDAYGQTGAGTTGFAIMPEHDLKGLSGQMTEPVSRWIGGWGHELGHAFGLPHPDDSIYWNQALMGEGYLIFPNSLLLETDKEMLNNSGFFF